MKYYSHLPFLRGWLETILKWFRNEITLVPGLHPCYSIRSRSWYDKYWEWKRAKSYDGKTFSFYTHTHGWRSRLAEAGKQGTIDQTDMGVFDMIGQDPETNEKLVDIDYDPHQ